MCALHCAQLLHTILHRTDLIIFSLHPSTNQVRRRLTSLMKTNTLPLRQTASYHSHYCCRCDHGLGLETSASWSWSWIVGLVWSRSWSGPRPRPNLHAVTKSSSWLSGKCDIILHFTLVHYLYLLWLYTAARQFPFVENGSNSMARSVVAYNFTDFVVGGKSNSWSAACKTR